MEHLDVGPLKTARGTIKLPGSKSISNRVLLLAALAQGETVVEFDLAYTNLNEKRIERAWIDLIFEAPEMNQIILRDVTLSRRPRAEV